MRIYPIQLGLIVLLSFSFFCLKNAFAGGSPMDLQKGISLGLFAEDPTFSYAPMLNEIRATGASHVAIVIPYYQHNIHSTTIGPHPRFSPTDQTIEQTLQQARRAGLQIFLFPILRLEYAVTVNEWRGALAPKDLDAWWSSYSQFILKFARLAIRYKAAAFCVGSELNSLDNQTARWSKLIQHIRRIYRGTLVYSANWDHYSKVEIWPLVDAAGISAYFPLTEGVREPSLPRLIHAWREQRAIISRWRVQINKPLIITELGYHSQAGTNAEPWDESESKPISSQEQADCLEAFNRVWRDATYLRGVYIWNWFGWGGPHSREYCPRGKSATHVICKWFGVPFSKCPIKWGIP